MLLVAEMDEPIDRFFILCAEFYRVDTEQSEALQEECCGERPSAQLVPDVCFSLVDADLFKTIS